MSNQGHLQLNAGKARVAVFRTRHANNYYVLGRQRVDAGALDEARIFFARALQYDPRLLPALRAMANVELWLENPAAAKHYLERGMAIAPDDRELLVLQGHIALKQGDASTALAAYERAIHAGETTLDLLYNTGVAHLCLLHGEEAEQSFSRLVKEQPTNHRAWDSLGCARRLVKDYRGAIEAFLQALQIDPSMNDARDHMAQVLLEVGNAQRAQQVLESALDLEPDRRSSRQLMGVAYATQQQYDRAVTVWEELIAMGEASAETHHLLANAYLHINDHQRAITSLEALLQLTPTHLPAHVQLALLLMEEGDYTRGWHHIEAARSIDPNHPLLSQAQSAVTAFSSME